MIPTVAIVGRPNVGKSTLFNRIVGERISITDETPGLTRDRLMAKATWLSRTFHLIDTGGIDFSDAPFRHEIRMQAEIAIDEAQVIVLAVDVRSGITEDDQLIARLLYKANKPVIVAVNKVDSIELADTLYEFYALGLGDPVAVSSLHGVGLGDLLDNICAHLPLETDDPYDPDTIRLALIGRPNVGKSSLLNAIVHEERVIVSPIEGTTRDAIDVVFKKDDQDYVIIDTAGMRKRGKVYEDAEKYSVLRALSAIERSDVCCVLIDGEQGIIEQDKKIAGYAHESGKAVVIVVNKWDVVEKDHRTMDLFEENLRSHFAFLAYAPVVFLSAKTTSRLHTLFPVVERVYQEYTKKISTSVLNDVIIDAFQMNPPKSHQGGVLKAYYATQVATKPPTFVLFVNNTEWLHFSYKRYLVNQLRQAFGFEGSPLHINLRKRD